MQKHRRIQGTLNPPELAVTPKTRESAYLTRDGAGAPSLNKRGDRCSTVSSATIAPAAI